MRFHPILLSALLFLAACSQTPAASPGSASNALPGATPKLLTQDDVPALSTQAGESALVYIDYLLGQDYVTPALTALGYDITIASDWTDFDSKLAAGTFDLAVGMGQGNGYQGNTSVLASYISGGGRAVAVDYEQRSTLATAFDASYTGTINQTSATFFSPVSAGITNPMTLQNPGWGVFSTSLAPALEGVSYCTFGDASSCLVVGNEGRTALLGFLSDMPPSADGQQLFENIFSLINAPVQPELDLYTVDLETAPVNKILYSVKVGQGVVYSGSGVANPDLIRVDGYRYQNGKKLSGNQVKVIDVSGDKVLTVVKAGTNTPNPTGGELDIKPAQSFGGPSMGKNGLVTLKSITVAGVSSNGAKLVLYGNGQPIKTISLAKTLSQTLALDEPGVGFIQVRANDDFTVDDVVFEVAALR